MSGEYLTVPTLFKGRFRKITHDSLPRWCAAGSGDTAAFRQDALALARQDSVMRFLIEMDRKLDTILNLLQRESIEADFPHEGYVLELSGSGLVLESPEELPPGQKMELLLMLGGYPQRLISVMAEVRAEREGGPRTDARGRLYDISYRCLSEEDRDAIIAFVFQEERRRIRRRKEEAEE